MEPAWEKVHGCKFALMFREGKNMWVEFSADILNRTLRDSIDQNAIRNREPAGEKITGLKFQLCTYIEDNRDN